jgi:uncharacterized protein
MSSDSAERFRSRYGPVALVAGASEGIGAAFARILANSGFDLVLVARRPGPLEAFAAELRSVSGREVRVLPIDLGADEAAAAICAAVRDLEIGLLVYNAASSPIGPFLERPLGEHLEAVAVNVRTPLALIHGLGAPMIARGRGGIVVMSSLAGFQGTPLVASYAAGKAFGRVLAEGLWDEWRTRGVDVLACCAGAAATPAYERSAPRRSGGAYAPRPQHPDAVAREALGALGRGPVAVTGRANRLAAFLMSRLLSRRRAVATMGKEMRTRYG